MANIGLSQLWDHRDGGDIADIGNSTLTENDTAAINKLLGELTNGKARVLTSVDIFAITRQSELVIIVARDLKKNLLDGANIIGMGTIHWIELPTKVNAYIDDVVVDSNYRGQKIGEKITQELIRIAKLIGAKCIDLTSSPSRTAANKLYQKLGFVKRETNVYRLKL